MTSLPLSASQKDIWTELLAWSNSCHLNIGGFSRVVGEIDPAIFRQALDNLTAQEDALRLIQNANGQQTLLGQYQFPLVVKSFADKPNGEELATQWQQEWMSEPFEVGTTPPIRFALVTAHKTLHYVVIQSLHIAMDGWSLSNAVQKLGQHYTAIATSDNSGIEQTRSYVEFIADSNKYKSSKAFDKDADFWRTALPTLPEPLFESRFNPPMVAGVAKAFVENCHIRRNLIEQLKALCVANNHTIFHGFLALLAIYLFKSQHRNEFIIGVPSLNRNGNKYKKTLGMFVGVIPINVTVTKDDTPATLVEQISRFLKQAYRHAKYPLSEQFKRLDAIKQGRDRLFDVIFSFEEFEFASQYGNAQVGATNQTFSGFSRYPLAISVCDFLEGNNAEIVLEGNEQYFTAPETNLIGDRLIYLVEQLTSNFNQPLSSLDICTPTERARQLKGGMSLAGNEQVVAPYVEQFAQRVALHPKSIACLNRHQSLSYQELWHCAGQLALELFDAGATRGDIVAFALDRGPEVLVAQLAISRLGATFLPCDVESPLSRLEVIFEESRCKILMTNPDKHSRFSALPVPLIRFDIEQLLEVDQDVSEINDIVVEPSDNAYVLFTSGTTGKPKGVVVSHKALSLRLAWICGKWGLTSTDRSLSATQVNFDPALVELFAPIVTGGSVAFPPAGRLLPESLPHYLVEFGATLMAFVPSTLTRFLDGIKQPEQLRLRVCCCGGEILSKDIAQRFVQQTGATLFNVYGPTEATIFATSWQIKPNDRMFKALPVGSALTDTQIFILNEDYALMPYGVVGKVFIAGLTLSGGYLNNAVQQKEKFVHLPHVTSSQLYDTGDSGWLDTDGVLHFAGRHDRQIKLRGYRIELNEIENNLLQLAGVRSAAAKLVGQGSKAQIHAWLQVEDGAQPNEYMARLAGLLPDYMLPNRIHIVAQMPYTANDKIDYEKLPNDGKLLEKVPAREPVGRLEKSILAIWRRVLDNPNLSVLDNFFANGGDSLSAVTSLHEIEQLLGKRLSLYQLVENPTVSAFAECLEAELNLPQLLVSLGDTSRKVSMYICASGNGDMLRFKALAKEMYGVCDLHMLQPPGNQTTIEIKELATLYATKIKQRGESEVYIAGFSVGGLAALETAKLLGAKEVAVKELFIVDTILLRMPKLGLVIWQFLLKRLSKSDRLLKKLISTNMANTLNDKGLFMQVKAMGRYKLTPYDGSLVLLKSSAYRYLQKWLLGGWTNKVNKDLVSYEIDTSHSGFFEPGRVEKLAHRLTKRIRQQNRDVS